MKTPTACSSAFFWASIFALPFTSFGVSISPRYASPVACVHTGFSEAKEQTGRIIRKMITKSFSWRRF